MRNNHYTIKFYFTVSSWKLSRTPTLTPQADAAMVPVIISTRGLIEEYYQSTSQSDEDCFYVPDVYENQAVVFRGQCENITGVQGFDSARVSAVVSNIAAKSSSIRAIN